MSDYITGIAILLLVLSPLFVPVAVTVAPLAVLGRPSRRAEPSALAPAPRFA